MGRNLQIKIILFFFAVASFAQNLQGQASVGINISEPSQYAVLHLVSPESDQGFLMPLLTLDQMDEVAKKLGADEEGLTIYNSTAKMFYFWDGMFWKKGLSDHSELYMLINIINDSLSTNRQYINNIEGISIRHSVSLDSVASALGILRADVDAIEASLDLQSVLARGNAANNSITDLTDPSAPKDAANKQYVDASAANLAAEDQKIISSISNLSTSVETNKINIISLRDSVASSIVNIIGNKGRIKELSDTAQAQIAANFDWNKSQSDSLAAHDARIAGSETAISLSQAQIGTIRDSLIANIALADSNKGRIKELSDTAQAQIAANFDWNKSQSDSLAAHDARIAVSETAISLSQAQIGTIRDSLIANIALADSNKGRIKELSDTAQAQIAANFDWNKSQSDSLAAHDARIAGSETAISLSQAQIGTIRDSLIANIALADSNKGRIKELSDTAQAQIAANFDWNKSQSDSLAAHDARIAGSETAISLSQAQIGTIRDSLIANIALADSNKGRIKELSDTAQAQIAANFDWNKSQSDSLAAHDARITGLSDSLDYIIKTGRIALEDAHFFIGNNDTATATVITGHISISNTGLASIEPGVIIPEMISGIADNGNLGNVLVSLGNGSFEWQDKFAGGMSNNLDEANVWIGGTGGTAAPRLLHGDVSVNYEGLVRLTDNSVITSAINNAAVTNAKLDKPSIPLSGFGPADADIAIGSGGNLFLLTGVSNPVDGQDAATKKYVDDSLIAVRVNITAVYDSISVFRDSLTSIYDTINYFNDNFTTVFDSISVFRDSLTSIYDTINYFNDNFSSVYDSISVFRDSLVSIYDTINYFNDNFTTVFDSITNIVTTFERASFVLGHTKVYVGDANDTARAVDIHGAISMLDATGNTRLNLANGSIYIGDGSGIGQQLPVTGDIGISNTGLASIQTGVIIPEMISGIADNGNLGNVLVSLGNGSFEWQDKFAGGMSNNLDEANVWIGGTGGTAAPRLLHGDASVNYEGLVRLTDNSVITSAINNAAVTNAKLDKPSIPLSGFGPADADIAIGSGGNLFLLTGVSNPVDGQDAATKKYVDDSLIAVRVNITAVYDSISVFRDSLTSIYDTINYFNDNFSSVYDSISVFRDSLVSIYDTINYFNDNFTTVFDSITNIVTTFERASFVLGHTKVYVGDANDTARAVDIHGAISMLDATGNTRLNLANGSIYIGDGSGIGHQLPVTGDIGISNTGLASIQTGAVNSAKILDGSILEDDLADNAVTYSKMQQISGSSLLLGSSDAGTSVQEISLGSGLSITGSVLNSTVGTVTEVTVASANGFEGTVANSATTPQITLSTSVTGLLKGDGTAVSAAIAGTDFTIPSSELHVGTTPIALNRASGAMSLQGITDLEAQKLILGGINSGSASLITDADAVNVNITIPAESGTLMLRNSDISNQNIPYWDGSHFQNSKLWTNGTAFHFGNIADAAFATIDFNIDGSFKTNRIFHSSDMRWKKDIALIDSPLDKVLSLRGVTYYWRTDEFPSSNFSEGQQVGLIAQEVEAVLPQLINTDAKGYKSVEYANIVALLIEAIKEQQELIEAQSLRISGLESELQAVASRNAQVELMQAQIDTLSSQISGLGAMLNMLQPQASAK
jgi:hypothetical protein